MGAGSRAPTANGGPQWLPRWLAAETGDPVAGEDLAQLKRITAFRHVTPGTRLMSAGATVERVVVVRRGSLHLLAPTGRGGRTLTDVVWSEGVVGDVALVLAQPLPVDVVAGDHSTLMELDGPRLLALLRRSPSLSARWMGALAQRVSGHERRLRCLLTATLTGQVADLLLEQLERAPGERRTVSLSHAAIAGLVGVSRQSVSEVMAELRRRGLVLTGYRVIEVLDVAALERLACRARPVVDEAGA